MLLHSDCTTTQSGVCVRVCAGLCRVCSSYNSSSVRQPPSCGSMLLLMDSLTAPSQQQLVLVSCLHGSCAGLWQNFICSNMQGPGSSRCCSASVAAGAPMRRELLVVLFVDQHCSFAAMSTHTHTHHQVMLLCPTSSSTLPHCCSQQWHSKRQQQQQDHHQTRTARCQGPCRGASTTTSSLQHAVRSLSLRSRPWRLSRLASGPSWTGRR